MNKIVLVALLAAVAGCGSKKRGADCEPAIAKGIENAKKGMRERAPSPEMVEASLGVMDQIQGVLIGRCKADDWPPEAVSCFATASDAKAMEACQVKLPREQASRLDADLTQVTTRAGMRRRERMPPDHPEKLMPNQGSDAAPGAAPAPGATAGSSDPAAAPGAAAPSGTAAPAGSADPAGGSAPK
ncbi:MAG TPA: hypothetical protein VHT91_34390 [Kofleriaceae bacterium]|jgi:hypothetical protein|nr:hypothetical protein [Kofleriaceae bacterium]